MKAKEHMCRADLSVQQSHETALREQLEIDDILLKTWLNSCLQIPVRSSAA